MEKVKLKDSTEYSISSASASGDALKFVVSGISNYDDFRSTLTKENLSVLKFYTDGGALSATYENYTNIKPFSIVENDDSTMDITVTLQEVSALQVEVEALRQRVITTQSALVEFYELVLGGTI